MKGIVFIYRLLLKIRYKIEISGVEVINKNYTKLFLPNHQAIVDPQIIFTQLYKITPVIPVVTESYFKIPLVKNILKMIKAVPVSDLTAGSRDIKVLQTIKENILITLKKEQSVLLYPSGHITDDGYEKIKNKKSAYSVVSEIPDNVQIIAIKVSGLWGSMWSKAKNGKSPDFFKTFLKGIFIAFANFVFFVPKRKINIQFIDITENVKQITKLGKDEFNNYLENVYNKNVIEIPKKIKYFFFLKNR